MSYKNRGMFLETLINKTIVIYRKNDVGIFHKKQIPITFASLKKEGNRLGVENGFVMSKSTTDYYGIYKGIFVAFEAKSTNQDRLPLANIKVHQSNYVNQINNHGGVAFYIVGFKTYDEFYFVTANDIESCDGASLSITYARANCTPIELQYPGILDFASIIDKMI